MIDAAVTPTPNLTEDQHRSLAEISLLTPIPLSNCAPEHQVTPADIDDSNVTPPPASPQDPKRNNRLLNPIELINLARMTFPKCEPMIDASGRFIIRGIERREGIEPGRSGREGEMFPFALMNEDKPGEAFVNLMKRKLASLDTESVGGSGGEGQSDGGDDRDNNNNDNDGEGDKERVQKKVKRDRGEELDLKEEDKELIEGLKRFRGSKLGQQVRDVCISQ